MTTFDPKDFQYESFKVSEIEDGFYHLQFDNPRVLNAFAQKDWKNYGEILLKLDQIEDSKAILISSTLPRAFTSGLNLKAIESEFGGYKDLKPEQRVPVLQKFVLDFQESIGVPAKIRTPTICILNGVCFGLALDICSACTIRIATEDAKLSIKEIKIGICADIGSLQRLPKLVNNTSFLYQAALTGEIFSGKKALDIGLVSDVKPDLASAVEYGKEIGLSINQNLTWTVKGTKDHIQSILDGTTTEQGLKDIALYNAEGIIASRF